MVVTETTELAEMAQKIASSPTLYLTDALGARPYQKQSDIAEAVGSFRRVSVVGCNGSGKDWLAARLALWWVTAHYPAKVVITGPTHRQVDDVLFNELRAAYREAPVLLGGRLFESPRWELDETTFIVGFSTDRPWNLQGFHSPHLLVIVTEAHAMDEDSINALYRLNPDTLLMVGNPFATTGPFHASHHQNRDNWATYSIGAYDTPNIIEGRTVVRGMLTVQDLEDRKEEWGEDSPMYRGSILAEFPDNLEEVVVPLSLIRESLDRDVIPKGDVTIACDVARFGQDKTVVVLCQGDHAEIIWKVQGKDLMSIASWLGRYCEDHSVDNLVVDDTGLGGGVTDRLREVGFDRTQIIAFKGGESAVASDRFANKIAEAWWVMRDWVIGGGRVPNDDALIGQMSSRGYSIESDRKISLQKKAKMINSPDEADALAMAIYGNYSSAGQGVW